MIILSKKHGVFASLDGLRIEIDKPTNYIYLVSNGAGKKVGTLFHGRCAESGFDAMIKHISANRQKPIAIFDIDQFLTPLISSSVYSVGDVTNHGEIKKVFFDCERFQWMYNVGKLTNVTEANIADEASRENL